MKLSREEAWAGTLESMVDNRVVFYLRRYNRDYQDYSRQMKELCEKYPAIIQLIDGNNGVTLNDEEYQVFKTYSELSSNREMLERAYYYYFGQADMFHYQKLLKEIRSGYTKEVPTLKDLYRQLMLQEEPEARALALSAELFTSGSLNTFAHKTNVDTKNRIMDYDIRELGSQLMPLGMLVTLDAIFNSVIQNWKKGKRTWIFCDEFYLLFRYPYSAEFFYKLWKRIRKYNGFVNAMSQNVDEVLRSDTARLMLANSEFLVMLNQASTDREELARLLNISDNQLGYITNVKAGSGLIRCSGNLVPFENTFPRNTKLYQLMTTKPGESLKAV